MIDRFADDSDELEEFQEVTRIYYQRDKVKAHNQEKLYDMHSMFFFLFFFLNIIITFT